MQIKGLEPPRISSIEPKSIVSTNFTISADGYGGIRTRGHTIKSHMLYQLSYVPFFWARWGSNPNTCRYEQHALPIELQALSIACKYFKFKR